MPRIALVTCRPGPEVAVDRDLPGLVEALRDAGADAEAVVWDDPDVDWADHDLAVIRSTWDYSWRAAEFTAWAQKTGAVTRLANPAEVIRWNSDKRYLGELAAAGVPTVPTRYLAPGDPADLPDGHEYVVKPTSGAGARFAARYTPDERDIAVRQLARMHAEGFTAMVQPYVRGIDVSGERALQFFDGRLLHASRKGAVLAPGTPYDERKVAHPGLEPWQPTDAEIAVAEQALAAVPRALLMDLRGRRSGVRCVRSACNVEGHVAEPPGPPHRAASVRAGRRDAAEIHQEGPKAPELLYARVDLVDGDDGRPRVMELELVEPNLFLSLHTGSVAGVVAGILRSARAADRSRP